VRPRIAFFALADENFSSTKAFRFGKTTANKKGKEWFVPIPRGAKIFILKQLREA